MQIPRLTVAGPEDDAGKDAASTESAAATPMAGDKPHVSWVAVRRPVVEVATAFGDTTAVGDTTAEQAKAGEAIRAGLAAAEAKVLVETLNALSYGVASPIATLQPEAELKSKAQIPELKTTVCVTGGR